MVRLNRAIALSHRDGGAVGLGELEPLAGELDGYHLFHTAGAEMLRHLGRERDAVASLPRALELTANPAEKRLLAKRLAGIVLSPRPTAFHPPTPVFAGTGR